MLNYKQKKSKELREDSRARLDLYQREAKRLSPSSSIHLKRRRMPFSMHPPQNSTFHSLSRLRSRKVLHEQQQQQQTITPGDILLSLEGVGGGGWSKVGYFPPSSLSGGGWFTSPYRS